MIGVIAIAAGALTGWTVVAFLFGSLIGRAIRAADQREQVTR
jgi:hypothetical protein